MQKEDIKFNLLEKCVSKILIFFIRLYKSTFSFWLGRQCRYIPTCSDYAILAIKNFGPLKGSIMSIWRILRCNPLSKGGYDHPENVKNEQKRRKTK